MPSAGWADSLAAGLGAALAGEDVDQVVGAIVKEGILNLIPLYAIGSVVFALAGPIKELLGVEKDPPLLGLILDADAKEKRGPAGAMARVARAAVLRTAGFARYQEPRQLVPTWPGGGVELAPAVVGFGIHKESFELWSWLIDLQDRLVDAYEAGGDEGIKELLSTSALHLQAFHAAVALQAWAEGTLEEMPYELSGVARLPVGEYLAYATKGNLEVGVRTAAFAMREPWFAGAEGKQLKGKWGLFKRLGLPSYQAYEAAILANAGPQYAPVDEVFPGAAELEVKPILSFEDEGSAPAGSAPGAAPAVAATGGASSSLAATAPTKPKAQTAAPKRAELAVAAGVGGLAILLALL